MFSVTPSINGNESEDMFIGRLEPNSPLACVHHEKRDKIHGAPCCRPFCIMFQASGEADPSSIMAFARWQSGGTT
jgi:hypothetical protein